MKSIPCNNEASIAKRMLYTKRVRALAWLRVDWLASPQARRALHADGGHAQGLFVQTATAKQINFQPEICIALAFLSAFISNKHIQNDNKHIITKRHRNIISDVSQLLEH